MSWFVRVGPLGTAYGPFYSEQAARDWLEERGFQRDHEHATFKLYAAHDPSLHEAHVAMRSIEAT